MTVLLHKAGAAVAHWLDQGLHLSGSRSQILSPLKAFKNTAAFGMPQRHGAEHWIRSVLNWHLGCLKYGSECYITRKEPNLINCHNNYCISVTKAQSNVETALLVRLGLESCLWLVDLISAPGWRSGVLPKGVFKAIHWCIKQVYSKYWLFKLGKRGIFIMCLQLLELCPFVLYLSHWLMLILQLNVLLVYIFKVAFGCGFIFSILTLF